MKDLSHDIIISGHNLDLTTALKRIVTEKMQKLFEHETHIQRLRVELSFAQGETHEHDFCAKGHIEIKGSPMIVSVQSDDLYKSIDLLENKLDRMIRRRSRRRVKMRKKTHSIEIPSELPKVGIA